MGTYHIITQELIHIFIDGQEIDGKWSDHPPKFWELEKKLSPKYELAWDWIYG